MQKKIQLLEKLYPQADCLACSAKFDLTRKDKKFCSDKCRKSNAQKAKVRVRTLENFCRSRDHYDRAAWLTYDVYRMPEPDRSVMYQKLLEAANGDNAKIRNILLDPKLLGAGRNDPHGRFSHDQKVGVPNIAKQVYQFCMTNYGCGTKDCIFDDGKPAFRKFVGDPVVEQATPQPTNQHLEIINKASSALSEQVYSMMLMQKISEIGPEDCGFPAAIAKKRRPIPSDIMLANKFFRTYGMAKPSIKDDYERIAKAVVKTQAAADLVPQERVEEIERQIQQREQELLEDELLEA